MNVYTYVYKCFKITEQFLVSKYLGGPQCSTVTFTARPFSGLHLWVHADFFLLNLQRWNHCVKNYIHHVWAVFSKDSKRCIRPVSLYETACFSVFFWLQLAFLLIFVMLAIYVLLRWVSSSPPPLWDCYWFANSSLYIKTV